MDWNEQNGNDWDGMNHKMDGIMELNETTGWNETVKCKRCMEYNGPQDEWNGNQDEMEQLSGMEWTKK